MEFSKVLIIASARFKLMARNKVLLILCVLLPLLFSLMVNRIFAKSSLYDSIPIAVIDEDNSKTSQAILSSLKGNKAIHLEVIAEKNIESYISREKVQAVYIFKKDMEKEIENGRYDNLISVYAVPGSITAMGISDIIAGEIVPYLCESKIINGASSQVRNVSRDEIKKSLQLQLQSLKEDPDFELPVKIDMRTPEKAAEDSSLKGDIFSTQIGLGLIIMFSTIFMLGGCSTIIKERENKVRSRIRASGAAPFTMLLADLIAVAGAGIIITLLQFIMLHKVFSSSSSGTVALMTLVCIIYIFCAAAMLILMASIFKNHVSFQSFMPVVILMMGILSGCIWSVEMMPKAMENISALIPSYWAHRELTEILLYGGGMNSIASGLGILMLMTAVFIFPAYLVYGRE